MDYIRVSCLGIHNDLYAKIMDIWISKFYILFVNKLINFEIDKKIRFKWFDSLMSFINLNFLINFYNNLLCDETDC